MNNRFVFYGQVFRFCGFQWLARAYHAKPNIRVIYTHEVPNANIENFRRNTELLLETRESINPETFFDILDGCRSLNKNSFLMTFDDGLLSSYQATKKFLDPVGIKAIFFIPTAILDLKDEEAMRRFVAENIYYAPERNESLIPEQWRFMTTEHLKDLSVNGHIICPHTHNHVFLRNIHDQATAYAELVRPKEILEDMLDCKIRAFAFPVGTERQVGSLAYANIRKHYDFCFTALFGVNTKGTDPYFLHRDCLPAEAPTFYTETLLSGNYDLYYLLKMRRLKVRSGNKSNRY